MAQNIPLAKELLRLDKIPITFFEMDGNTLNVLDKVHYKNLFVSSGKYNERGHYSLTLVTFQNLGLKIPGTDGIALVLNPGTGPAGSEIDVVLNYKWDILKYNHSFNNLSFTESIEEIFNILLEISGISGMDFVTNLIVESFGNSDKFGDFVTDFNTINTDGLILTTNPLNSDVGAEIENILGQFDSSGINVFLSLFTLYIKQDSFEDTLNKINTIFKNVFGEITLDKIKDFLKLTFDFSINDLAVALEFPRKYLRPVFTGYVDFPAAPLGLTIGEALPEPYKSRLSFNIGSIRYNSQNGLNFNELGTVDFQDSFIGSTDFSFSATGVELDFSRDSNIPAANAAGYGTDFIGAFIPEATIGFPAFWNHDDPNSTGQIIARNLLVGTGGISGTIGMEAKTAGNPSPIVKARFGQGFEVSLDAFSMTFKQNAIIGSNIHGSMIIPGFEDASGDQAKLDIIVHIGQDGDFSVTVSEADGIAFGIPNVLKFIIKSASMGRKDDRFFLSISGSLSFDFGSSMLADILPANIEFQEIIIWDDGQFEIKGGGLELPQALTLKYPPVELSVTSIHLGSTEMEYDHLGTLEMRNYKYFGFDGAVNVDPGGVEAKGKGIQVYFTTDNSSMPLDMFVRIESMAIDLVIPGDVKPEDAMLAISGFLSLKPPASGVGTEYAGGIEFSLPKIGISGGAAMRFNPKVPNFIIDANAELAKAIPLASTGLGIYGFRGLFGKNYVATKNAAGVADSDPWWKYYKAKIASEYKEGVQISKFESMNGFSVGMGVSLATTTDGGKTFSSKLFMLLSLRELLMLQGQAAILDDRIELSDPNDPPFFAMLTITKESIEAALGVNYLVPDDKKPGWITTLQGVMELGFFFNDSSAWYLNIGRDIPESYRIQARLIDLFECYFYMMISANGIRAGAGAEFELEKKFGPLRAHLFAYLDIAGQISFKPKQMGGSIQLGGGVELSVFGFGLGVSVEASLAAESPEPKNVSGSIKACIKVLKKTYCAKFEFNDDPDNTIDTSEIGIILKEDIGGAAKAVNIQTKENFDLNYVSNTGIIYHGDIATVPGDLIPPAPGAAGWKGSFDNHIIPLDCFIDLDFKNGVNPNGEASTDNFGKFGGAEFELFVPPQKGKTPRVKHSFKLEELKIYAWDPYYNTWKDYEIYEAMTPLDDLDFVDPADIDALNLKYGYWQKEQKNKYNKLRILSQTPLSYATETTGGYTPENSDITASSIFCPEDPKPKTCVDFADYIPERENELAANTLIYTQKPNLPNYSTTQLAPNLSVFDNNIMYQYKGIGVKYLGNEGLVVETPVHLGHQIGVGIRDWEKLEITFNEPMTCVDVTMLTTADPAYIEYYQLVVGQTSPSIKMSEQLVHTATVFNNSPVIQYEDAAVPVDKIVIRTTAQMNQLQHLTVANPDITQEAEQLEVFLNTLVDNNHLMTSTFNLFPDQQSIYNSTFLQTPLYQNTGGPTDNVVYNITEQTATTLKFNIYDQFGFSCNVELEMPSAYNWNNISSFSNLLPDGATIQMGTNNTFTIDATIAGVGTVTLTGKSSYNVINYGDNFSSYVYKVCYLSAQDYNYNTTIPSAASSSAAVSDLIEGVEKTFQPIWRPNTTYAIAIQTYEEVTGAASDGHRNTFFYGFRTKGPVGHFHNYLDNSDNEVIRADYQQLLDNDMEDGYQLSKMKHYIDFRRSYPNADGDLLNAKPLFYKNPKLLLFFKKQYAYAMFGDWDLYLGNEPVNGGMDVVIQDVLIPDVDPVATSAWKLDPFGIQSQDVTMLNNMINNGDPIDDCTPTSIAPNSVNAEIDIDMLEPLKLYTAIFNNSYQRDVTNATPTTVREVHRYPFRTSRYGDFTEQVKSYQLKVDDVDPNIVLKAAVFDVNQSVPSGQVSQAINILNGSTDLIQEYADYFERILQGALKLGTLHPAVTTEFNKVYNTDTNKILGMWIRCPEPFNDPKLPASELETTIRLSINGDAESNYEAIFSKDKREVFITQASHALDMPTGSYQFTFDYREWDGSQYINAETVTLNLSIS